MFSTIKKDTKVIDVIYWQDVKLLNEISIKHDLNRTLEIDNIEEDLKKHKYDLEDVKIPIHSRILHNEHYMIERVTLQILEHLPQLDTYAYLLDRFIKQHKRF